MIPLRTAAYVAVDYDGAMYLYFEKPVRNDTVFRWLSRPMAYLGAIPKDMENIPVILRDMTYESEPRMVTIGCENLNVTPRNFY